MKKENNLRSLNLNKKGVSAIISYVLLISITLSLSILVYDFLNRRVNPENKFPECPEGVNVVIYNVDCWTDGDLLNITLKNRGRFNVDGYYLRYHIDERATFGIYNLTTNNAVFKPGEERVESFNFQEARNVKLVDVQPFMTKEGKISCMSITTQRVNCNPS